mmetsp:Transcript_65870/g.157378  ORF Transcript_65870/g.157378 Transcript_65870/m.157378 type:complete len:209 (+) Transcript_65870:246-872(+)
MDRHHNRKKSASWCSRANQIEMRWPVCSKIYEATAGLSVGVVPHFWPACPVLPTAWQAVSSHCARRPLCRTTYRSCQRDFPDPAMLWERPGQTKKDAQQIWRTSRHLPSRCLIATQMLPPCEEVEAWETFPVHSASTVDGKRRKKAISPLTPEHRQTLALVVPLPRARRTNCHQVRLRTSYTGCSFRKMARRQLMAREQPDMHFSHWP